MKLIDAYKLPVHKSKTGTKFVYEEDIYKAKAYRPSRIEVPPEDCVTKKELLKKATDMLYERKIDGLVLEKIRLILHEIEEDRRANDI